MQCREFSVMADLSDKYYTVKSLVDLECPDRSGKDFTNQNEIAIKKQISCSYNNTSSMQNEAFL